MISLALGTTLLIPEETISLALGITLKIPEETLNGACIFGFFYEINDLFYKLQILLIEDVDRQTDRYKLLQQDGRLHSSGYNPHSSMNSRIKRPGKLGSVVIVILVLGIGLTILNIYELHKMREDHALHIMPNTEVKADKYATKQPVLWVSGKRLESGYLKHVFAVFDRIGYALGDADSVWDVNHFPGSGYITSKVSLAQTQSKYIPKAFKIPTEKDKFLTYTKKYPEKLWVQKNNNHRGIKIKKVNELDLSKDGSFVQQYIDKPFLIDKRKFDIGVYTIQTSIDPLRVYIVDDDALFRFCEVDYYPFDPKNVRKYVVEDNYTPVWEMPSLKKIYLETSYTMKGAFDTYLQLKGKDYKKLWNDIKQAIVSVYLQKEPKTSLNW
ncbi:hypothetical protein KUTeg_013674 [Tegillarca granosa]|uniref:Uncharacterized protein n=1 Tax=Tegillarca granosa TaxID=220873 RepID=A0ABQ9EY86_TEGGR|nr:hypothetical protein KUTeg_013674 [Tegillarca granosa]